MAAIETSREQDDSGAGDGIGGGRSRWSFFGRPLGSRSDDESAMGYVRLREELSTFGEELDVFVEATKQADSNRELLWLDECKASLQSARETLKKRQIGDGWRFLHAAERISYNGLDAFERRIDGGPAKNSRIGTRALVLSERARDDLDQDSWRRQSVEALLSVDDEADRDSPTVDALAEAHRIIHGHYEGAVQERSDPKDRDHVACDGCGLVVDTLAALTRFRVELGHLEGPLHRCVRCRPSGPATYWAQNLDDHLVRDTTPQ